MKKIFGLFGFILALPALLTALEIVPVAPQDGATVPLLSPAQKAFVTMPREPRIKFFADAEKLFAERAPIYAQAPLAVDTDGLTPAEVAGAILDLVPGRGCL